MKILIQAPLIVLALALTLGSCRDEGTSGQAWISDWTHAYEEDGKGVQVYRPTISSTFPASHFRMRYVFSKNGTCEYLVLHPADAHFMAKGTWKLDPSNPKKVLIFGKDGKVDPKVSFTIVEIGEGVLKIRR